MSFASFTLDSDAWAREGTSSDGTTGYTGTGNLEPAFVNFRATPVSAAPQSRYGDYQSDVGSGKFNCRWDSWQHFQVFLSEEQQSKCIELRQVEYTLGKGLYVDRTRFVCARGGTGGKKTYEKRYPERQQKIGSKATNCGCTLTVKRYYGIGTVLGIYRDNHDHPIGNANLRYTRLSNDTRDWIASMVRLGVQTDCILKILHGGNQLPEPTAHIDESSLSPPLSSLKDVSAHRNDFATLADVCRIEKRIESEGIRLSKDDGLSVAKWAERLGEENCLLSFKSRRCPIPYGSDLRRDTFILIIQTPWQCARLREHGENLLCIDGTHNTTMYENMTLTTLVVRDKFGHGIPVAWMISDSGTEQTIGYFLTLVRKASPKSIPRRIMSDRDLAQINACRARYPEATILLCWWHVLHSWQQHLVISKNEELWKKLQNLVRIQDSRAFDIALEEIALLAPEDFMTYLNDYWLCEPYLSMWSGVCRVNLGIYEISNTNMLVEAWHHVLKGKFLEGRRNRRVDHLVAVLISKVVPHYALRHRRQLAGFDGDNLETQKRKTVEKNSAGITLDDIHCTSSTEYLVDSQTHTGLQYKVDITAYLCDCPDFPLIQFCKHLSAVQRLYPNSDLETAKDLDDTDIGSTILGTDFDSLSLFPAGEQMNSLGLEGLPLCVNHPSISYPRGLPGISRVAQKIEQLAARLRSHENQSVSELELIWDLEPLLDDILSRTMGTLSMLPTPLKLSPNLNSWPETQAAMMPARKTRAKRVGDQKYGAGGSSGKKVKRSTRKSQDDRPPAALPESVPLVSTSTIPLPVAAVDDTSPLTHGTSLSFNQVIYPGLRPCDAEESLEA